MLISNSKTLKFFKEKEARGLLRNFLDLKVPILSNILTVNTLF